MTNDQIKHMVNRFLGWRLPDDFNPDAGISFKPMFNENTAHPMKSEPVGTNLFSATQAEAMVLYLVEDMPPADLRSELISVLHEAQWDAPLPNKSSIEYAHLEQQVDAIIAALAARTPPERTPNDRNS